jgi:hypothetical protein
MPTKSGSPPPKDTNNPKWGYLVMQQQLKLMNKRFIKVMSGMTGIKTKMDSLQNGLDRRGLKENNLRDELIHIQKNL